MSRVVLVVAASLGIGGCAVLAGAGLGGAGAFSSQDRLVQALALVQAQSAELSALQ